MLPDAFIRRGSIGGVFRGIRVVGAPPFGVQFGALTGLK